jgi:septal ring factor EnvC (AmiA/AmiB activator)
VSGPVYIIAAVIGALALVIGAVLTYRLGKRAKSGKVETSEAADLWEESRSIRAEQRAEISGLRDDIAAVHKEHEQCEADLKVSRMAISELETRVKELEMERME